MMDKDKIKNYLSSNFLSEADKKAIGLQKTEDAQKLSKKQNDEALKNVSKEMADYTKSLDSNKKENAKEVVKRELSDDEKKIHDDIELFEAAQLALDYDNTVDEKFRDRFEKALAGDSTMGNSSEYANVVPKQQGFTGPDFGKTLVAKVKRMSKVPQNVIGGGNTMAFGNPFGVKNGNYAMNENNNKSEIKESMKRLKFKKPFNGLENALNLIPESYKVNNKMFEMTDGNETYKIRWEGSLNEGRGIALSGFEKTVVNEDVSKIKHLMGFKSQETLGTLKGNQRLDENAKFSDIWKKSKALLIESEEKEEEEEEEMTAKEKEFAALAEPKDKITYADKIAGAKKNKENLNELKQNAEVKQPVDSAKVMALMGKNSLLVQQLGRIDKIPEVVDLLSSMFEIILKKHPELNSGLAKIISALKDDAIEAKQAPAQTSITTEEMVKDRLDEVLGNLDEEESLNELDANIEQLREKFFQKLTDISKLENNLLKDELFNVDAGALDLTKKYFAEKEKINDTWKALYNYVRGTTPPKLAAKPGAPILKMPPAPSSAPVVRTSPPINRPKPPINKL